jgi:hypothetical protein
MVKDSKVSVRERVLWGWARDFDAYTSTNWVIMIVRSFSRRARSLPTTIMTTIAANDMGVDILDANPYDGHPALTQLESEVLWEYAKLSQQIKTVRLHNTTVIASRTSA